MFQTRGGREDPEQSGDLQSRSLRALQKNALCNKLPWFGKKWHVHPHGRILQGMEVSYPEVCFYTRAADPEPPVVHTCGMEEAGPKPIGPNAVTSRSTVVTKGERAVRIHGSRTAQRNALLEQYIAATLPLSTCA